MGDRTLDKIRDWHTKCQDWDRTPQVFGGYRSLAVNGVNGIVAYAYSTEIPVAVLGAKYKWARCADLI
jgi:hypothetical protein